MSSISIFDIFKIGVGPSSSHTLGPWSAALEFRKSLAKALCDEVIVTLFGSLAKTGKGHCTDIALQMGLLGFQPTATDRQQIENAIDELRVSKNFRVAENTIQFIPQNQIIFDVHTFQEHPNTIIFEAKKNKKTILTHSYISVGGGFIERLHHAPSKDPTVSLTHDIESGELLMSMVLQQGKSMDKLIYENELCFRSSKQIEDQIVLLFETTLSCVFQGMITKGILPGGLNVKRRAPFLFEKLITANGIVKTPKTLKEWKALIKKCDLKFSSIGQWISCFAIAVNEENASLGRVITSPTNGAAGVIPAVLLYYYFFEHSEESIDLKKFYLIAGQIGILFKNGATISAALGGCQAEIGVSSAMAAGALTAVMGGDVNAILMAAEIAMEHHLGLTCDPVGGLVQIPCIERNAMGAIKAITASQLALAGEPKSAKVHFDAVVKTMWMTALDMNSKYKETSEAGLAYNISVNFPNC